MIIYKSSDIVKRAMQLADLENSDFISFSEKISVLNEAYQQLYQKSINANDNAFVEIIHTNKTKIKLPNDFYQLKSINLNNGGYITTVLRRPSNQTTNQLSYDLLNNEIIINGYCSGDICIEYYPIPKTLTLPNNQKNLTVSNKILALRDNIYVSINSDNNVLVGDITDSEISYAVSGDTLFKQFTHIENDYISFTDGETQTLFSLSDCSTITTTKKVVIYNNTTYLYDDGSLLLPTGETVYSDINLDFGAATLIALSSNRKTFVGLVYGEEETVLVGNETETTSKTEIGYINKFFIHGDIVYLINGTKQLQAINLNNLNNSYREIRENNILDIQSLDSDTGYGYLSYKLGKYIISSFFEDTVLNFPLNTYYVFMSYILAVLFKNKQGADISALSALYSQAEEQFYDSLKRDDWCNTRITNVY